jgi:hypothetical protein
MGYWGEAMAHHHPIWEEENLEAARAVLQKVPDGVSMTEREQRYLDAVRRLFGEGDKLSRHRGYADQMERLHRDYPEDQEAACLYALSLLGLATHFDGINRRCGTNTGCKPGPSGWRSMGRIPITLAGPIIRFMPLTILFMRSLPYHRLAVMPKSLRPCPMRNICRPIFFSNSACGSEAAASSKAGWESSADWVRRDGLPLALQDYHSLYWLHYVYLQQGRYGEAEALLRMKQQDMAEPPPSDVTRLHGFERTVSRNYDRMIAAYIVETERWEAIHQPWDVEGYQFGDESPELAAYVRDLGRPNGRVARAEGESAKRETVGTFTR